MLNYLIILLIIFCCFLPEQFVVKQETTTFCKLRKLYIENDIKYIDVVLAQDLLETGNFTSVVWKENSNSRGMKHNKRGYSLRKQNGHAFYETPDSCVKDFKIWQKDFMSLHRNRFDNKVGLESKNDDNSLYYFFLENLVISHNDKRTYRYAEDINYIAKLKNMKKKVELLKKQCKCYAEIDST